MTAAIVDTGGLLNSGGVAVLNDSSVTGTQSRSRWLCGRRHTKPRLGASLIVTNSVISGNGAYFSGGGIYNSEGSTATLTDSIVSDNRIYATKAPAAAYSIAARWSWWERTVAGNEAQFGAGIANRRYRHDSAQHDFRESDRLATTTIESGGGIGNYGKLTLVNSTVSNNEARAYGGGIAAATTAR